MQLLPNRRGEQIKKERAGKASIRSHVTLIADFINAIDQYATWADKATVGVWQ